jgi:hypothetical protein
MLLSLYTKRNENTKEQRTMQTFNQYALKNIRIDQDNNGLFAQVPSQDGNWYTVRCVESKTSVFASHCSCHTFSKKQACGHVEIAQAYWNKIYAPKVEAPKVAKARKPRNGLVRKVRGGGLVRVEQKPVAKVDVVKEAEKCIREAERRIKAGKIIEATVPVAKTTDISKKGNFGTKAFSLMR